MLFAYADRQNNGFMWAVSHDGDFDAVVDEYHTSPERAAAFEGAPVRVTKAHVAMVEPVVA